MVAFLTKLALGTSLIMLATEVTALPSSSPPSSASSELPPNNGTDHIDEYMLKRDISKRAASTDIVYLATCSYNKNWGDQCGWTGQPASCGCVKDVKMALWYRDWKKSKNLEWPQDRTSTNFGNNFENSWDTMRWQGSGYKIQTGILSGANSRNFQSAGVGNVWQWFHGDNNGADVYYCRRDNSRVLFTETHSSSANCWGGPEYIEIDCYSQYYCAKDIPRD